MIITGVSVKKLKTNSRLRGIASVTFDNCFVVHSIKIIENDNRLFIAMPSNKTQSGFTDIVHPTNSDMRSELQNMILNEYNKIQEEN